MQISGHWWVKTGRKLLFILKCPQFSQKLSASNACMLATFSMSVLNHTGLYWTILTIRTIHDQMGPERNHPDHKGPCRTKQEYVSEFLSHRVIHTTYDLSNSAMLQFLRLDFMSKSRKFILYKLRLSCVRSKLV